MVPFVAVTMIWLLPIPATALLGVVLVWVGLRGRRVDDHPICRRCGFDLFGRPQSSDRCAECGTLLSGRRAMIDGRRVRRGGMIAGGTMALALGLTAGAGVAYVARGVTDWQPYKPVWWLLRELDHPASRAAAIKELASRQASSLLSQAEIGAAADKLLALQADPRQMWLTSAGDFLEGARARRLLSDDRWRRYGRQGVRLALEVRPWVRRGDVIPFQVRDTGVRRLGSRTQTSVPARAAVFVGSEAFGVHALRPSAQQVAAPAPLMAGEVQPHAYEARLPEGPAPVRVEVDVVVERSLHLLKPTLLATCELTGELKVFARHDATVLVRNDESLRSEMRDAVGVLSLTQDLYSRNGVTLVVECKAPPAGVAHATFVSVNGTWTRCGVITCPPKETRRFKLQCGGSLPRNRAVKVMFFPAPQAAAGSTDTFEVWNGIVDQTVRVP